MIDSPPPVDFSELSGKFLTHSEYCVKLDHHFLFPHSTELLCGSFAVASSLSKKVTGQRHSNITELMIAASRGDQTEVRRLIERGSEINAADIFGNTALTYAAMGGHAAVLEFLLQNGADVQIKNKRGHDCLELAEARGHEQTVSILRCAKLLLLIRDGEVARIKQSLEAGLDLNIQIMGGWTPLMVAALENQEEIVELLLEYGAHPGSQNSRGLTAATIASRKGHLKIVELLNSRRADTSTAVVQVPEEDPDVLHLEEPSPGTITDDESKAVN